MSQSNSATITARGLAFWETLIDVEGEPRYRLKAGEKVKILGSSSVYGGLFGDKEYYRIEHPLYGIGYIRTEGVESE